MWTSITLNSDLARNAKNDCYLIFIAGSNEDIIAFRFAHLRLRYGCLDVVEVFPYLREPIIENSTQPEYVFCNQSMTNPNAPTRLPSLSPGEIIYSSSKVFGIRVRFEQPPTGKAIDLWPLNITGEFRFLQKDLFQNDGRLISGSYCDFYFFASTDSPLESQLGPGKSPNSETWQYFHSPRFPANYPPHIQCTYKFIGRPGGHVEIIFEELRIHKHNGSCSTDKLTVFDSETANMNAVIDVLCDLQPTRRILSTGPDLVIELNISSNRTAKGFRGKFKFSPNESKANQATSSTTTTEIAIVMEKIGLRKPTLKFNAFELEHLFKEYENCRQTFDSRFNKSGIFESPKIFDSGYLNSNALKNVESTPARIQCRYEFYGNVNERIQIKFHDFYIPPENETTSQCSLTDSLQILTQVRGKYEPFELICGAFLPKPLMSDGSKMLLQFIGLYPVLRSKIGYYGFKAEYQFLTDFGISTGQQIGNNCTYIYNSTEKKSGWFGSPNFPGLYPLNIECNYLFYGESNEKVVIRFTYFDVEGIGTCEQMTASDYVEFSNYITTDRKYLKYCGKREKFVIRSDGRFFRVTFHSNDRFDKTGFRALYDFENQNLYTFSENTSTQSYVAENFANTSRVCTALLFSIALLILKIL